MHIFRAAPSASQCGAEPAAARAAARFSDLTAPLSYIDMLQRLASCRSQLLSSATSTRRLRLVARGLHHPAAGAAAVAEADVEAAIEQIVGPAWDLTAAYAGLDSSGLSDDVHAVRSLIDELTSKCAGLDVADPDSSAPETLADIQRLEEQASVLLGNIGTFANCELTVDGSSPEARAAVTTARQLGAELSQATAAHGLVLQTCSEENIAKFLELVPESSFSVRWARRLRAQTLSLAEETLVTALSVDGHAAWANMYDNISSSLKCEVNGESLGARRNKNAFFGATF